MKLTHWEIGSDYQTVRGQITGSMHYPDGTKIETSRIMAAAYDGDILLIKTKNSVYECDRVDYLGDPDQLETFVHRLNSNTGSSTKVIKI